MRNITITRFVSMIMNQKTETILQQLHNEREMKKKNSSKKVIQLVVQKCPVLIRWQFCNRNAPR